MHGIHRAALLSFFALLAGCNGGGGGGSGGSQSNQAPSNPPPATSFNLTSDNALDAASIVFRGIEQADSATKSVIGVFNFFSNVTARYISAHCSSDKDVAIVLSYDDKDMSGDLSVGDVLQTQNLEACNGVARTATLAITTLASNGDSLTGDVHFDSQLDSGLHAQGSFNLTYSKDGSTFHWIVSNAAITTTIDGTTQTFSDAELDKTADGMNTYTLTFSGQVDSGKLGGAFNLETVQAYSGIRGHNPSEGRLLLSTPSSGLRVEPASDPALAETDADYELDPDGSGQFGDAAQAKWSSLLDGSLFDWVPDWPPRFTSIQIRPADPATSDDLNVVYSISASGYRRITNTYEWRRNGTVIDGQVTSRLPASLQNKGDTIEVIVTANDGEYTVTDSASTTIRNSPPSLTVNGVLPPSPLTTDDLSVDMSESDADGDMLQTTYVWRRNGSVINGQTGPILPASEHRRGDVIAVSVTVSDGTDSVTGEGSTTIQNSPPVLSVVSPPTTIDYGDKITFKAAVSDADGDPTDQFKFALTHGPAGMTVDPDTGEVDWVPSGPMFGRTMDVSWGITVNDPTAQAVSGTIHVEDSTRQYPLMRTSLAAPLGPAGLRVGDFDGDGKQEMLIASNRALYELQADGSGGYRQSWVYPFAFTDAEDSYGGPDVTAVAAGDVDGDGRQEIFAAARGVIAEFDGVDRWVVRTIAIDANSHCSDLEFGDLDGDHRPELVCLTDTANASDRTVLVLEADDLSIRWQYANADYGQSIAIGNVDSDPALEIVTSAGYVFDGATFANQWLYGPGFGIAVETGDLDGDGIEEIVGAVDWTAVQVFSGELKSPLWEIPTRDLAAILVADVDGDGTPEIVVGDGQWGNVTAYRYNKATKTPDMVFQINSQGWGVSAIGVGDVDSDGQSEIIWGTSAVSGDQIVIAGLHPDIGVEWTSPDTSQFGGPIVGGELVHNTLTSPAPLFASPQAGGSEAERLIAMDPDTGDLTVSPEIGSNFNRVTALAISDYDADGADEAFVATASAYNGYFAAYDFFGGKPEWTSPQATTQTGYGISIAHADLTGDGKDELIGMTAAGVVYVYDVYDQSLVWQSTTLMNGRKVLVADIDGDGTPEILALTSTALYVYSHVDDPVPHVQTGFYALDDANMEMRDVAVGDTDGDGRSEILLLTGPSYLFAQSSEVRRLDQALQVLGSFTLGWRSTELSIEPSTFPRKNLIVPSAYGTAGPARVIAVDAQTGMEVWRSPLLPSAVSPDSLHYVDPSGNGKMRISIGTQEEMYLTR